VNSGHTMPGESASRLRSSNWFLRLLFGLLLAGVVLSAVWMKPEYFALIVVFAAMLAAREWHRLVRTTVPEALPFHQNPFHLQTLVTTLTVALGVLALFAHLPVLAGVFLVLGTVAGFVLARLRGDNAPWQALGVLYIGIPALSLVGLHLYPQEHAPHSLLVTGLFVIVWTTDTAALIAGRLIGGRKLAPAISPGKTWAGTIGGSLGAALCYMGYVLLIGGTGLGAFLFALVLSAVAQAGDLFESFVKRRFGRKDSGSIIPGHGGILDRVDSTFAAAPVLALLVLGLGFNPLMVEHL
jgi:phosphatidate cytidylyltransferase